MFNSESGWLHFLFANPQDHYYTDSIVKLDCNRYIYYHLKKKGYRGIFFFQDLRNGILVRTEDRTSAEKYRIGATKGKGFFQWQYVDAPITIERQFGREVYQIAHKDCDELRRRIIEFIKEPEDKYAFIFPIDVYAEVYEHNEDRLALITALSEWRQKSIFLIVANCSANSSLGYLTDRSGVFNSSLGDEVEKILKWKHRFVWYDAMKKALKSRYNVWNQFRREDIERLLSYGAIIENWPIDWTCFNDYVDFIYAWYHSSAFSSCYRGMFPAKEKYSLDALEQCLREKSGQVWLRMNQEILRLNKKRDAKKTLLHVIKQMYSINTETMHPILEDSFEQRELAGISIEELLADGRAYDRELLMGRFFDAVQEIRKPWNNGNVNMALQCGFGDGYEAQSPISYCTEMMSKLSNRGIASCLAVEKIVNMLEYSVGKGSEERQFASELFDKKIRCRETAVRIAMEIAELQQSEQQYQISLKQCEEEFQRMLQKVRNHPAVDASITSVTVDMLLNEAEQKRLVNLDTERTAKKQSLAGVRKKIAQYEHIISQFEDAFERLSHHTLEDIPVILREITEELKDHAVKEVMINRKLDEAISDYTVTQKEMNQYTEPAEEKEDYREECRRLIKEGMIINV